MFILIRIQLSRNFEYLDYFDLSRSVFTSNSEILTEQK